MTEAMPFLQKAILLSYAPRSFAGGLLFFLCGNKIGVPTENGVFCGPRVLP